MVAVPRKSDERLLMGRTMTQRSAMVVVHSSSYVWKSTPSTNIRPGRKFRFRYFTPDSTLPLVWARSGRHTRGSPPPNSRQRL